MNPYFNPDKPAADCETSFVVVYWEESIILENGLLPRFETADPAVLQRELFTKKGVLVRPPLPLGTLTLNTKHAVFAAFAAAPTHFNFIPLEEAAQQLYRQFGSAADHLLTAVLFARPPPIERSFYEARTLSRSFHHEN